MSSNLCQDNCVKCGHVFTLGSFRGQPIEFRQRGQYVPQMGCKLVCPCGMVYFGYIRTDHKYWSNPEDAFSEYVCGAHRFGISRKNEYFGKFARRYKHADGRETFMDLGYYQIDLSYYESFNDEGEGVDSAKPGYLFAKEDDETTRWDNHREHVTGEHL